MIDITGIDKAKLLVALYNASKQQGLGFLAGHQPLTEDEAREMLEKTTYFDYLHGRVMKVDLEGDELNPWLYDRDNGEGAAQRAIDTLRQGEEVVDTAKVVKLRNGTEESPVLVSAIMLTLTTMWDSGLPGMLAVWDLREITRNPGYKAMYLDMLKEAALVDENGAVHQSIRNIVESATEGDQLDFQLVSPIAA